MFLMNAALTVGVKYPAWAATKVAKQVARNPETKQKLQANFDEFAKSYVRTGKARDNGIIQGSESFLGKLLKDPFSLFIARLKAIRHLFSFSRNQGA